MLNHPLLAPWPHFEADEIAAATATLTSGQVNYWTGGLGKQFESAYAAAVNQGYGLALANGTVALELALRALRIGPGDEVIVASRSYVASASCVLIVGATPIFADIDLASGNLSAETIQPHITPRTKAVIPVHVGGLPCDMPAILSLAKQHGLKVIEDCAQAHGAMVAGQPVGSWGDAAIFSFCQDKIISTGGEGGMLVLRDEHTFKQAWAYKDIGRDFDAVYHQAHPPGFRWFTHSAGSNFRMTEFQSAIGLKQLEKLPVWVKRRQAIGQQLESALALSRFIRFPALASTQHVHAYYRTYGLVHLPALQPAQCSRLRDRLIALFTDAGLPCFVGSCAEIYREKAFANYTDGRRHPNAKHYAEQAFCLLCHHTITDAQVSKAVGIIHAVINAWEAEIAAEYRP